MVSGSAALLLRSIRRCFRRKSSCGLMNTAEANILVNPATAPGVLAPITRVGAGEVRVDRALATETLAYDQTPALPASRSDTRHWIGLGEALPAGRIRVKNLGSSTRNYTLAANFPRSCRCGARGRFHLRLCPMA